MHKKEDYYHNAYEPYILEALFCFGLDLLLSLLMIIIIVKYGLFESTFFCLAIPVYFLVAVFVNYRIALLSILERINKAYISTSFCIYEIQEEWSASGPWGSIIPKLYPKNQGVDRYKIIGIDSTGKPIKLHCAISEKKLWMINDNIMDGNAWTRTITYGKYTHIIMTFDDKDMFSVVYNRNV